MLSTDMHAAPAISPQLELKFLAAPKPAISPEDVALLVDLLRGHHGWRTAAQITEAAEARTPGFGRWWTDRKIRALAEASDGAVVSYPGSPGYCLFDAASQADIAHAVAALKSQGQRMLARALALDRRDRQRRLVDRPQSRKELSGFDA